MSWLPGFHYISESINHSAVSNSMRLHWVQATRLLCPWNSPGKNTGVGSHSFFQEIFPTQDSNPGLLHCRQILYRLSHQESLVFVTNLLYILAPPSPLQSSPLELWHAVPRLEVLRKFAEQNIILNFKVVQFFFNLECLWDYSCFIQTRERSRRGDERDKEVAKSI